jgi:hypothetical protein
MVRSRPVRWPFVIAVIAVAGAPIAEAAPGDAPWDGAVFAGPTAPHPSNVATNPAAVMLSTPGLHYFLGGVGTLDQLGIDRTLVDVDDQRSAGPSISSVNTGAGAQLGLAKVWPGGMVAVQGALLPPDETIADRDALRFHTRGSRTRAFEVTVGAGFRVTDIVWVALAAGYGWRDTVLRFSRDTAMEAGRDPARGVASDCGGAPCGFENPLATEQWTINLDVDRSFFVNLRLTGGVVVQLPFGTMLGITYQQPWERGRLARRGEAVVIAAPRDGSAEHRGDATLFDALPRVVRIGTRTRVRERLDLVTEVRGRELGRAGTDDLRTFGGDLGAAGIPSIYPRPRGMRWAGAFEVGLEEIDAGQFLRLGGRVGYDTGAVGTERLSARAPWGAQLTAGGGVQLRLSPRFVLQGSYNVGWQLPAEVVDGAFDPVDVIDCVDSGYDIALPACSTVRSGYGAPTNDGDYRRWSHVGRVMLRIEVP